MTDQLQRIDERLDRLENRLPTLPAAGLRLQRAAVARSCALASGMMQAWWGSLGRTADRAGDAAATVAGTGREVAQTAERELAHASRATGDLIGDAASDATSAIEAATLAADPDRHPAGDAYRDLTRAELYRRATARDIGGRSTMSKSELIAALVDADDHDDA
jgi:hypothetical protein